MAQLKNNKQCLIFQVPNKRFDTRTQTEGEREGEGEGERELQQAVWQQDKKW